MRTAVSWYRSAQARYLLARHDAGGIKITEHERVLLLEVTLAGRERRTLPRSKIERLRRLVKRVPAARTPRTRPRPPPEQLHVKP